MNRLLFAITIGFNMLLLNGCASTSPLIVDTKQLTDAAEKILFETVYHNELFTRCAALGGEAEIDAINVQHDWINANAALIGAADNYYSQQQKDSSFDYEGNTLSPAAIRLTLDASQKARDNLSLNKRSPINQQKTCSFKLAQMTGATLPLARDPQIASMQTELLKYEPLERSPLSAPRLAGDIKALSGGKSFFAVNAQHQSHCADAYTLVIANNWPKEAYANFCGSKVVEVLTCDWGKCDVKKL